MHGPKDWIHLRHLCECRLSRRRPSRCLCEIFLGAFFFRTILKPHRHRTHVQVQFHFARAGLAAHVGASPGDCIFFSAGPAKSSRALLGAARGEIADRLGLIDHDAWAFVWVVDPPLFEPADDATAAGDVAVGSGAWTAVHHAFTSPKPEYENAVDSDPGGVLADAYDIVCNGNEIGGGSIRIHRRDIQERVFAVMGLDKAEAEEKFGFLLEAFMFGAPPHGGIAFGWDRITALLAGMESIREVIAFPKTGGGIDPLTDAPAPITAQQRKESGIDAKPKQVDQA